MHRAALNPQALKRQIVGMFAGGVKGCFLDFGEPFGEVFADDAGTVAASNASVIALVRDASGNMVHARQATNATRPIRQMVNGCWVANFASQAMVTDTLNLTNTDRVTIVYGSNTTSIVDYQLVCELSTNFNANVGSFAVLRNYPIGPIGDPYFGVRPTGVTCEAAGNATLVANAKVHALTAFINGATVSDRSQIRANGLPIPLNTLTSGAGGNFGSYALYVGMRAAATLPFAGSLSFLLVVGRTLNPREIDICERFGKLRTGLLF